MDKTDTFTNLFVPFFEHYGNLSITKEVDHPYGEDYKIPDTVSFEFEVNLGNEYANQTITVSQNGVASELVANGNGVAALSIQPGSTVYLLEIAEGTNVIVTEIQRGEEQAGFSCNNPVQEAVVGRNQTVELKFVNTYTPKAVEPVNLQVTGTKKLEGREWQEGDSFTFLLEHLVYDEEEGKDVWKELSRTTVSYDIEKADYDQFNFNEVIAAYAFDTLGIYEFRISEISEENAEGITYDNVVSYFDVYVSDADMDGSMEIQEVNAYQNASVSYDEEAGAYVVDVIVTNQYAALGNATAVINIEKIYKDQSGVNMKDASGFSFELYDEYGEKVISEPTSAAGETGFVLEYNAGDVEKTFTYTLKEANAGEVMDGIHYDAAEYRLQICVVDNLDGTIRAAIAAEKVAGENVTAVAGNEEAPDCLNVSFENIYDAEDTQVVISGTKSLSGRNMANGEFKFNLYQTNADFSLSADARLISATTNVSNTFSFAPLPYDQTGTYYYVATEDASSQLGGIVYDDTKYQITVTVTDENGVLGAVTKVTDEFEQEVELSFQNNYVPASAYVTLKGEKILNGAEMKEEMFEFNVYRTNEQFVVEGEVLQKVENNADGIFTFDTFTYDSPGVYHYVVKEDTSKALEGMEYDDTIYQITVKVTDDGNGTLLADTVITADGVQAEAIVFENIWTEKEQQVVPDDSGIPDNPNNPSDNSSSPSDQNDTSSSNNKSDTNAAKTGDQSNILNYLVGMLVSVVIVIVVVRQIKKKR